MSSEDAYFQRIDKVWDLLTEKILEYVENNLIDACIGNYELYDLYRSTFMDEFGELSNNIDSVLGIMADTLQFNLQTCVEPHWDDIDWDDVSKTIKRTLEWQEGRYSHWTSQELYEKYTDTRINTDYSQT